MSHKQWKWLAGSWFLLTTLLLAMPGNALPKTSIDIPFFDKLVHVGLFAILCFLFVRALTQPTFYKITVITLTAIVYGTIMEYVQLYLVAYRSFDVNDIIADAAGAFAGVLIGNFIGKK
jgi:VanZ family protein